MVLHIWSMLKKAIDNICGDNFLDSLKIRKNREAFLLLLFTYGILYLIYSKYINMHI